MSSERVVGTMWELCREVDRLKEELTQAKTEADCCRGTYIDLCVRFDQVVKERDGLKCELMDSEAQVRRLKEVDHQWFESYQTAMKDLEEANVRIREANARIRLLSKDSLEASQELRELKEKHDRAVYERDKALKVSERWKDKNQKYLELMSAQRNEIYHWREKCERLGNAKLVAEAARSVAEEQEPPLKVYITADRYTDLLHRLEALELRVTCGCYNGSVDGPKNKE